MDALNILRADVYPRCTEYVDDMIRITQDLIDKVTPTRRTTVSTSMLNPLQKSTVS